MSINSSHTVACLSANYGILQGFCPLFGVHRLQVSGVSGVFFWFPWVAGERDCVSLEAVRRRGIVAGYEDACDMPPLRAWLLACSMHLSRQQQTCRSANTHCWSSRAGFGCS